MTRKTTEHATGVGEVLFMAAARPLTNAKTGKSEYSVKIRLSAEDAAVAHLKEIAEYKIDTKTNRSLEGTGQVIVNFTTEFEPTVMDASNEVLAAAEVPFFDGRTDKATAAVSYKVIDYGNNKIVRLSGIKLLSLDIAPKGDGSSLSLEETLNALSAVK